MSAIQNRNFTDFEHRPGSHWSLPRSFLGPFATSSSHSSSHFRAICETNETFIKGLDLVVLACWITTLWALVWTAHFDSTSFLEASISVYHNDMGNIMIVMPIPKMHQDAQSGTTELSPSDFLRFFARFSRARCLNCKEHSASVCCFLLLVINSCKLV